jgi:hypothetical protein
MQQSSRRRWALITGDETFADTCVTVPYVVAAFAHKVPKYVWRKSCLKCLRAISRHDFMTQLRRELVELSSERIETYT